MNRYDCETVRDLLPLHVRSQLLSHEATAVDLHLGGCAECTEEGSLVRVLAGALPAVPAGLEERVLRLSRQPAPARWTPARWASGRLAMAATFAAAIFGGALVLQRAGYDITPDALPGGLVMDDMSAALGWMVGDDPLLRGGSTLQELSLEELELVLAELDS
jgi:predicted anti-sigma-YlaC factor YlaD